MKFWLLHLVITIHLVITLLVYYDPEQFRDDLHLIPFDITYIFEDIDNIYWAWSYLLSSLLDDHPPIKCRTANREHVPFMTPKLLEAIRKCKKLKRLYNKSKCRLDWDRYKTQQNVASSLRRKAVSNYFRTSAANAKGNPNCSFLCSLHSTALIICGYISHRRVFNIPLGILQFLIFEICKK